MNGTITHTLIDGDEHFHCTFDWSCDLDGVAHDSERWEPEIEGWFVLCWVLFGDEDEPRIQQVKYLGADEAFSDSVEDILNENQSERLTLIRKIKKAIERRLPDETEAPFREVG